VELINDYRASKGLDRLLVSDVLSDASTKHCLDMSRYGFFSHTTMGSDYFRVGANAGERMVACGYPPYHRWGENIAGGFKTAADVFAAWKNSASHNENMLSPYWKVIGIAFEVGSSDWLWATDFGDFVDSSAHENGQGLPPDTTAPTVVMISPAAGSTVTGVVTITATASDDRGVTRVELYINGSLLAGDDSSPYAIVWETNNLSTGDYAVQLRAYDKAGNCGVADYQLHVSKSVSSSTTTSVTTTTTTTTTTIPTTTTTTATGVTSTTSTTIGPSTQYADVSRGSSLYEPVMALSSAGIINGYPDGLFRPNSPLTRAQFAKVIVLAIGKHTSVVENAARPSFRDVNYNGDPYPFDYVEEAAALHIITGYSDGNFLPSRHVTRLQLAMMLVRAAGDSLAAPPLGYRCPFGDVPAYGRDEVALCGYNGLISGITSRIFDPYSPATRGQVAKVVYALSKILRKSQ
jgi:hypothetical protein